MRATFNNPSLMSNIRLDINLGTPASPDWQTVNLPTSASITITVSSPLWTDQSSFAEEFSIPIAANAHILGNTNEIYGERIFNRLYRHQARIWACGIPVFSGVVDLDEEVEFDDDGVSISVVAEKKSLSDRLKDDGIKTRDVEFYFGCLESGKRHDGTLVSDGEEDNITQLKRNFPNSDIRNIPIGLCNAETTTLGVVAAFRYSRPGSGQSYVTPPYPEELRSETFPNALTIDIPQMLFPKPYFSSKLPAELEERIEDFVSLSPYNPGEHRYEHPFCNVMACVQRYECGDSEQLFPSSDAEWLSKRGYTIFDVHRLNSSPCFYVLFWLEQLFSVYLGVDYDIKTLTDDGDMLRLCFVNAKCKFKADTKRSMGVDNLGGELGAKRGIHIPFRSDKQGLYSTRQNYTQPVVIQDNDICNVGANFSAGVKFPGTTATWDGGPVQFKGSVDVFMESSGDRDGYSDDANFNIVFGSAEKVDYHGGSSGGTNVAQEKLARPYLFNPVAYYAMATSENLPDNDASEVIEALENAFGFKLIFNDTLNKVTAVRYNDVLRSTDIQTHYVVIEKVNKRESGIRGFRLKYGSSSEAKKNAFTGQEERVQGGDDTTYNYNDYRYVRHIQDENAENDYVQLIKRLSCYDESLYISDLTGNAYRIKVDQDASDESKWYPSLFEVGGFRDVVYGDCSDDRFVREVSIGFKPFIPNDVNVDRQTELMHDSEATGDNAPRYAMFLEGEHHQPKSQGQISLSKHMTETWCKSVLGNLSGRVNGFKIAYPSNFVYQHENDSDKGGFQANYNFYLPQGCDDGDKNSNPMNSIDFGFMLGFMRSSNASSKKRYNVEKPSFDFEDNYIFSANSVIGDGSLSSDSIDQYGNPLGTISLKLKAEKPILGDERPYSTPSSSTKGDPSPSTTPVVDYSTGNPRYYDIDSRYARRGLFDRYWYDYAYFITHCSVALITIPRDGMGILDLTSIDLTVPHRFGDYVGFIQSYSYSVDASGLASVTVELLYMQ